MKKLNLLIALPLLAGSVLLAPTKANAQDNKQTEFETLWYEPCFTKKDNEKCYALSKELIEKYPSSAYVKNAQKIIRVYDQTKAWEKFQTALTAFYAPPQDAAKLDQLFAASEAYLKFDPAESRVHAQMALAGINGAFGQFYKDFGRVKGYADTAMKSFASTSTPEGWKPDEWLTMRDLVLAQSNQYLGWMLLNQHSDPSQTPKSDQEQALGYIATATQIKGKDGVGWKDPHNYWLRSTVYNNQYVELKKTYEAMTEEQKLGEPGKEIRAKINTLLDTNLIPEYARVLATATRPESKNFYDAAKPQFDAYWIYRTDAADKADAYIKNYASDPTIATVAIPAKAETADVAIAPAAPTPGAAPVKLSVGGKPGASDTTAKTTAKGATAKGGSKSRRKGKA